VNATIQPQIVYDAPPFEVREFFKYIIGMSASIEKPVLIKIRFNAKQAPFILSQPIHQSQKVITSAETHTIISLFVIINFELVSWIYSFGPEVEVLEPLWFRDQISDGLKKASKAYEK
jgi:predicted DNA-binding transcriptional regulator YafY